MKKTVKRRNGRKSVKKNAKKRVSTRKNKQRGGMNKIMLFICICLTIAVLYYKHVPTMELPNIDIQLKNPTKYSRCLVENNAKPDPFTFCRNKPGIYREQVDINIMKNGFLKCLINTSEKIEEDVNNGNVKLVKGYDASDYASRVCNNEAVGKYNQNEKQKHAEECLNSLHTSRDLNSDCFSNVRKFYYESELRFTEDIKDTNGMVIVYAEIPGHQNPQHVVGNKDFGYYSTTSVDITEIGMSKKEIKKIFEQAQKAISGNLPKFAQKIYFLDDGDNNIIRYVVDSNNPNAPVLEFHYFGESEIFEELRKEHLHLLPHDSLTKDQRDAYLTEYPGLYGP